MPIDAVSVVTFLESLSNIPIQLFLKSQLQRSEPNDGFWAKSTYRRTLLSVVPIKTPVGPFCCWVVRLDYFFCIYIHIHYYSFIYTLAAILPIFCKKHRALFPSRLSWQHWPAFKDHAGVKAVASAVSRTASILALGHLHGSSRVSSKGNLMRDSKKIVTFCRVLRRLIWLRTKDALCSGSLFPSRLSWQRDYCWDSLNRVPKSTWHWLTCTTLACL